MDLSIIIVNWNSVAFLRACLHSIYIAPTTLKFEVIVIDNASYDGAEMMVRREFPNVTFIQSKSNLGFAGANNVAFEQSSGRNILFLNPDTEVVGNALNVMCSALDAMPDAGAVGCKLLNSDLSVQTSCIQAFPTILNQTLDFDFLQRLFPRSSLWGMRALFTSESPASPIDIISGACLMIRRIVFEQVGKFSTNYFMYAEDMDLCYKVGRAGWRNYFVAGAEVLHHEGRSSRKRPNFFASIMMRESKLTFMRLRHGRAYAACFRCATAVISIVRVSALVFMLPLAAIMRRTRVARSLVKWFKILRWSIGFENWASTFVSPGTSRTSSVRQDTAAASKIAEKV